MKSTARRQDETLKINEGILTYVASRLSGSG
jgi:hypothetical protein